LKTAGRLFSYGFVRESCGWCSREAKEGWKEEASMEEGHGTNREMKNEFTSEDNAEIEKDGEMKISWRKESEVIKRGWLIGLLRGH
jgi:hypothetical protein